jgi:GcrA cell cycle regulator
MWTDEKVEQLKVLYAEGLSASQIAVRIGCETRNMVVGKIDRLGLRRDMSRRPSRPSRTRARRKTTQRVFVPKPAPVPPKPKVSPMVLSEKPEGIPATACTIADLGYQTCRWPCWGPNDENRLYCGAVSHLDLPYCERHCRVAFTRFGGAL